MSNISRRQFLKGAGVATLAVAAAGVLAGCSGNAGPDVPDVPGVTTRPVTVIFIKDDSKGEYIIVFVTDVTMTPTKKTIDVKLLELPNNFIEAKAEVAVDATGVSAADIQLPDGYKLSTDYGTVEELLKVRPFGTVFIVTKI